MLGVGAIVFGLQQTNPPADSPAAFAAAAKQDLPRENAVLVVGSTGRTGVELVQKVWCMVGASPACTNQHCMEIVQPNPHSCWQLVVQLLQLCVTSTVHPPSLLLLVLLLGNRQTPRASCLCKVCFYVEVGMWDVWDVHVVCVCCVYAVYK